jgi:hypothetical protein
MASNKKNSKNPPRFEIGEIVYENRVFEFVGKDWRGNPTTQKKDGMRFRLLAVGPTGRYIDLVSEPFEGKPTLDRTTWYIPYSAAGDQCLNQLITALWNRGWQPTSTGHYWYEIRFRRLVPEPETAEEAGDTKAKIAPSEDAALAAEFKRVEAAYTQLRADFAAGRINPAQYRAALGDLKVQEPSGRLWMVDGQSGGWQVWDGKVWKRADPHRK